MNVLALITARGGSKSIPKKNTILLAGKPLIAWTIEVARQASAIDHVIVSTDSEEILQVAKTWGAEAPFIRPQELAADDSPHIPVITHALQWLNTHKNYQPDYVMLLQPTSPLRSLFDIETACQIAFEKNADSVVSVYEVASHPYLTKFITKEGKLEDFIHKPDGYLARQSLPPVYVLNGAIYLVKSEIILKNHTFYIEHTYAYIMPPERSMDIDTPWDLYLADLVLQDRINHENN